jgi:structural maintenance of chromosome 4
MNMPSSQFPSSTKRLFDLITPKDVSLRPAFYMALKDTLVASDLDTAVSIAYEGDRVKWRVVTIDGIVVHYTISINMIDIF